MDEELVRVEFRVPAWVHVDVANREIVSVHVDDLSIEGPVDVTSYSGGTIAEAARRLAIELTNDDGTWPAWTIGFDHS